MQGGAPIRLRYFLRVRNVGDRINPQLIDALFGCKTIFSAADDKPHLMAVGSILGGATPLSHIWGTGVMCPSQGVGEARAGSIHAVRGKLTYEALRASGLVLPDLPLGDPAFLVKRTTLVSSAPSKKYRLGLAPHYVDRSNPHVLALLREEGVVDLNVHDDPAKFLAAMAACEAVASSSLHGLVFAEALAIPNVWLELSDQVAGGGFKFADWFSTMARPQNAPFVPDDEVQAADLIDRAVLHEPQIDEDALLRAFPSAVEITAADEPVRPLVSLNRCRSHPLPIFIISYNRGAFLARVILSYLKLATDVCIVIHDNGSDDPATLRALEEFENSNTIKVYRRGKISQPDELDNISETISHFFADWVEPSRYVVTDCDVDMSATSPDAIKLYDELLERCRDVDCVGPMLTIRDVSPEYALYNHLMNRHIFQLWQHEPEWIDTSCGRVAALHYQIDTTFQLCRAGETFQHNRNGLRVYFPYEARHLDWYHWREVTRYAGSSSAEISHWSNTLYTNANSNEPLLYDGFFYVDADESGELVMKRHSLLPPPAPDFATLSLIERIAATRRAIDARRPMMERWLHPSDSWNGWDGRAALAGQFLSDCASVVDLGCGQMHLEMHLAPSQIYIPVDLVARDERTRVINFDEPGTSLPEAESCAVLGVLEYLFDARGFILRLAEAFPRVVVSYHPSDGNEDHRLGQGWVSALTVEQLEEAFAEAGFVAEEKTEIGSGECLYTLHSSRYGKKSTGDQSSEDLL